MIRDARQVGVAQVRQDYRFQPELAGVFVRSEKIFLEGDIHAEIFVHGAVNGPHAALAQDLDNAIAFMQKCSAFESHSDPIKKSMSKAW